MTQVTETGLSLLRKEMPQLKAIMGLSRKGDTQTLVLQELEYLSALALTNPTIEKALPISIVQSVKSVLKQNLSLDPAMGLVYTTTRSVNVKGKWETIVEIKPSANGLLSIARQAGRLLDFDRPKITKDSLGKVIGVSFRYLVPTININGTKGARWKEDEFDEADFERWMTASHNEKARGWKEDSGKPKPDVKTLNYANRLYSSWKSGIDPEFARAKAIRHSGLKKSGTNQNEVAIMNFDMAVSSPVINADVEAQEEFETEFTAHEEISINSFIPNSNDL